MSKDKIVFKLTKDLFSFVDKIETQLNLNKEEEEDILRVQRVVLAVLNNHRENYFQIEKDFMELTKKESEVK